MPPYRSNDDPFAHPMLDELEELLATSPDIAIRLGAAMRLLRRPQADGLTIVAGVEAATGMLHLGKPDRSLRLAQSVRKLAAQSGDIFYEHAALLVQAMAMYQFMARATPGSPAPGLRVVRSLERGLEDLTPYAQSSALSFLVSWHTIHEGIELVPAQVAMAKRMAEKVEADSGASQYLSFLADFRAAEAARGDERESLLQAAGLWVPELGPRHTQLARNLIEAIRRGDDCSIRIDFDNRRSPDERSRSGVGEAP